MRPARDKWSPVSWYARRGWEGSVAPPLDPDEEAYDLAPPAALVLVVHGIGERLWSRRANPLGLPSLRESVDRMRAVAAKVSSMGKTPRAEFLPVEWHSSFLHDARSASRLAAATPSSVPLLRQFANEVLCDVLYYDQEKHRRRMQQAVVSRANELFRAWLVHNPTFLENGGVCVVVAHSLGSVILFDLLSQEALTSAPLSDLTPHAQNKGPFDGAAPTHETTHYTTTTTTSTQSAVARGAMSGAEIDAGTSGSFSSASAVSNADTVTTAADTTHTEFNAAAAAATATANTTANTTAAAPNLNTAASKPFAFPLFACVSLGSPVGCFCAVRGIRLSSEFKLHSCPRYFNVYHRNDPVAYRLEPLLNDDDDEGSDACDNENDAHNDAHDDAHNGGAVLSSTTSIPSGHHSEGIDHERPQDAKLASCLTAAADAADANVIASAERDPTDGHGPGSGRQDPNGEPANGLSDPDLNNGAAGSVNPASGSVSPASGSVNPASGSVSRAPGFVNADADAIRPPAYVPFAGGKDGQRLHIKLRRKVRNVQRSVSAVQQWVGSALGSTLAAAAAAVDERSVMPILAASRKSASAFATAADSFTDAKARDEDEARGEYALNSGNRVDWVLQETELEVANEYLSALQAHTMYFESEDVVSFLLRCILPGEQSNYADLTMARHQDSI